jgi:hypothetical protein
MRATGCLCVLLGALLALQVGVAEAEITPIPKPAGGAARPGTSDGGSQIAPVTRPATRTTIRPATKPPARSSRASPSRTLSTPTRAAVATAPAARSQGLAPEAASGGREQRWIAPSGGGRDESALAAATAAAAPAPTPLELVGAGESLPSYEDSWPSWLIPLLTLLAAAEAFVLVRLARGRLAQAPEIEF